MSLDELMRQTIIVFLMIGVGFAAQKTKLLTEAGNQVLSDLLVNISLPFTLLASANIESGAESVGEMLTVFGLLLACYVVSAVVCVPTARALRLSAAQRTVFIVHSVLPNSTFIGLPLTLALFGPKGVVYTAGSIMAYNLFFFTYGMSLYRKGARASWRTFVTPTNLATAAMLVMMTTGWRLPDTLESFCGTMGSVTTPLAMLIIGVMLGSSHLQALWKRKLLYLITLLRCFVFPLAFAFVLSLTPLPPQVCLGAVVLCACASGSLGAVVARQTDTEPLLAGQAVAQTTLVLMLSLPVVVWLAQRMFYAV